MPLLTVRSRLWCERSEDMTPAPAPETQFLGRHDPPRIRRWSSLQQGQGSREGDRWPHGLVVHLADQGRVGDSSCPHIR